MAEFEKASDMLNFIKREKRREEKSMPFRPNPMPNRK
jgi:hypothetical protein